MKKDKRDEILWTDEGSLWVGRAPKRPVSVGSYLYDLYLSTLPRPTEIIEAGGRGIPEPPEEFREAEKALSKLEAEARKMARVRAGAAKARREGHKTRRAEADQEELLAVVQAYRRRHPEAGRLKIAAALVRRLGRSFDPIDPDDHRRAIAALCKRIERAEKSLDA